MNYGEGIRGMDEKILIVDDDKYINDMLTEALNEEGYKVSKAYSGTEALLVLEKYRPDLVLLDLMLPGLSGEELLTQIEDIPVIVVSAKTDSADKVSLLLNGAEDYITKPFNMEELMARIKVRLRKRASAVPEGMLKAGDITLYDDRQTVKVHGNEIRLTRTETAILKLMMRNPGQPIGRTTILDRISIDTPDCTERSLKQHISNIRHKLEIDGKDHIEAIYGIGFRFVE